MERTLVIFSIALIAQWCVTVSSARTLTQVEKILAARSLSAANLPDPKCHTGVISLSKPKVCCAGYCGECSDYPTCGSVRGQDSANACCATKVYEMRCGNAPANVCLKSCKDAVPPCIMDSGEVYEAPDPNMRHAGTDCLEAVPNWQTKSESAMTPVVPASLAQKRKC